MSLTATKKRLVGRRIVGYEPGLFSDGRRGWAHDPTIILDNGARLRFVTEETEGTEYGTCIIYVTRKPAQP